MTALVLALLLQDGAFEARMRIERRGRGEDAVAVSTARLRVVPGRALEVAEGRSRLVLRAGAPPDRFHPAELWLHDEAGLRRRFEVETLPGALPDAAPRAPVAVRLRGAAVAGAEAEEVVMRLVPRDEALRRRLSVVRAWADPETLRIRRAEFHFPMQVTVITLDGFREAGPTVGPAFDFEGAGVRKDGR
jgi:hypothetical protein